MRVRAFVVTASIALAAAACGADAAHPSKQSWYENRMAAIDRDPYSFTCGDQKDSARFGKHAHFALADETRVTNRPRIRVAQSIFYAVTELCRDKPRSYRPGQEAVAAVKSGRYYVKVELYR